MRRLRKLLVILVSGYPPWIRALVKGVPAGVEHRVVLATLNCRTLVDVGANRGQFALAARRRWPGARIVAFEPLETPAVLFDKVFDNDERVQLHRAAIGPDEDVATMHLSKQDDSSSLLAITSLQDEIFPGTAEVGTARVRVAPLSAFLTRADITEPALLKIDVQGYELEVLRGCESLLAEFDRIYCECSFVELYEGQGLAGEVIEWLAERGYALTGVFNGTSDGSGRAVQADFLFTRQNSRSERVAADD